MSPRPLLLAFGCSTGHLVECNPSPESHANRPSGWIMPLLDNTGVIQHLEGRDATIDWQGIPGALCPELQTALHSLVGRAFAPLANVSLIRDVSWPRAPQQMEGRWKAAAAGNKQGPDGWAASRQPASMQRLEARRTREAPCVCADYPLRLSARRRCPSFRPQSPDPTWDPCRVAGRAM